MKVTIDVNESLYRRLKVEAVRRGRTVRELVEQGIRGVLDAPSAETGLPREGSPDWFGTLRPYAAKVESHEMVDVRASIARGRTKRGV